MHLADPGTSRPTTSSQVTLGPSDNGRDARHGLRRRHAGPDRPGGWTSRLDAYSVLALGVLVWAVGVAIQHTWTADFLLHVATVKALARDLLQPPDPMVGVGFGSPYYSPLIWLMAAVVRVSGLSPTAVFAALAVGNAALVLWAFRRFCRWFTPSALGAALALLATLFLWGIRPPVWSGFLSFRSLAEVLPYPSTTAFGLMLLAFDRLLHYWKHRGPGALIVFGLLGATITLIHSFTGVNTALGALAVLLAYTRRWRANDLLRIVAVGAGALLLVTAWPFATLGKMLTGAPQFAEIHRLLADGMLDPAQLSCAYGLLGLIPLLLRLRDDRRDPLVVMFGLAAVVLVIGFTTAQYHLLRVVPVALLPLHVAFAAFVTGAGTRPGAGALGEAGTGAVNGSGAGRGSRRLAAAVATVILIAGLAVDITPLNGFIGAVPTRLLPGPLRAKTETPSLSGPSHEYDFIRNYAPEGSTILTDRRPADRHLNWLGYYTVNPGWPDPWLGDEAARSADRATVRDAHTEPAARAAIADRYGVRCLLITHSPAVTGETAVAGYQRVRTWQGGALFCR